MTPKEKSYAKTTLTNRMSQLQENSDNASEANVKNLYYAPNIKALQIAINIINKQYYLDGLKKTVDDAIAISDNFIYEVYDGNR